MATDIVGGLRASLIQSRSQLAARLQSFSQEALSRVSTASSEVGTSLDLLRQVFSANLAESESARMEIENLNTLLAKQVGSAPVGFSRFTNPQRTSSFQARRAPTFGRRQATLASSAPGSLVKRFGS